LPPIQKNLENSIVGIDAAATIQATPTVGTHGSSQALTTMGNTLHKYAYRAYVRAGLLKFTDLESQLNHSFTYYTQGPKETLLINAKAIYKLLSDNNNSLAKILTDAQLLEIAATITAYENEKDVAQTTQITKKATGTDQLNNFFDIADDACDKIVGLAESHLKGVNDSLVSLIEDASILRVAGAQHTELVVTALADEDGSILTDATVTDPSKKLKNVFHPDVSENNLITIPTHKPGSFPFIISAPGRITVNATLQLLKGKMNTLTVRLKKEA
jgi:hypothetical protein